MIRHLFTLLWNQKKSYAGIILEQMMVFIVLMVCMISLCDAIQRYNDPGQLNTSHTLTFGYVIRGSNPQVYADMASAMGSIVEHLNNLPKIRSNLPTKSFGPTSSIQRRMRGASLHWSLPKAPGSRTGYCPTDFIPQW